jgi:hypothetical protein
VATYNHEWDIGAVSVSVSAKSAMAVLQSRPNDVFPFTVKGRSGATSIKMSEVYDLLDTIGTFDNWGTGPDPVEVVVVTPNSFTFRTLTGHHRGAGQTITFETFDRGGHVWLRQYGTYTWTIKHPFSSLFNWGANLGASGAWALQAHNLRAALGVESKLEHLIIPGSRTVWPQW